MTEKLDVGRTLSAVFETYRAQAAVLLPAAALVFAIPALITGLILSGGAITLTLVLLLAISFIATFWYEGVVVQAVRDIRDGVRDLSIDGLFRSAAPVVGPLIGAGILAGLGIAVGFVLLIVPGLILLTIWALVVPVIVVERRGVIDSFKRSRELVRGNGWPVFGVVIIIIILQQIVSFLFQSVGGVASDNAVTYGIATLVGNVLVAPLHALAAAVMFFALTRTRGE